MVKLTLSLTMGSKQATGRSVRIAASQDGNLHWVDVCEDGMSVFTIFVDTLAQAEAICASLSMGLEPAMAEAA